MLSDVLILLALVLVNGFFAGSEIAVVSLRSSRVRELVAAGGGSARAVGALRREPERFLATVQIGITVVGAAAGAFGGSTFAEHLAPALAGVLGDRARPVAFVVAVALISYLSLVLGELVPKSLALRYAERYALLVSRPLSALSMATRPLVVFLTASSNAILRAFGDRTTFAEARLSPEELRQMMEEAGRTGSVHPEATRMATRAIDFAHLTAAHVAIPRTRIVALDLRSSEDEIRRAVVDHAQSRMPVFDGNLDEVVGYVTLRDVVRQLASTGSIEIAELLRPAYFTFEAARAIDVLGEMRSRRQKMAIVLDEYGGVSGLVLIEDLLEELVGEIAGEWDAAPSERLRMEADGAAVCSGETPLRDVNRELGLDLPEGPTWSTVAGLCLELADRIPARGQRLTADDGTELEVLDATARSVLRVRIRPPRERTE